ncbi:MAG: DinB family protein [Gemmatimonadales bacterium]
MTLGELLADDLRRAVRGEAWHGPSLHEIVAHVHSEEAIQRPIPSAHNIWELMLHIKSWSNIALRRIKGGQPAPYEGEDWPDTGHPSEELWDEARKALTESFERLSKVVAGMSDAELLAKAPQSDRTVAGMVSGVAQHAAYHGGQISLLKKVVTKYHRRTAL